MSANPAFKFPRAYGGTDIGIFNEIIRKKAERYRCGLIDFAKFHLPYVLLMGRTQCRWNAYAGRDGTDGIVVKKWYKKGEKILAKRWGL